MKILNIADVFVVVLLSVFVSPAARAQQPGVQKTLYERLGRLKGITMVSDDFINRLVANKTLNQNPAINAGRKSSPPPYLKFQVSQLVCEVSGGPCNIRESQ
jgi:hemoglobin